MLGAAAIVELIWSVGKCIYAECRNSISTVSFKSILLLRISNSFWDFNLVSEAMRIADSEQVASMFVHDREEVSEWSFNRSCLDLEHVLLPEAHLGVKIQIGLQNWKTLEIN